MAVRAHVCLFMHDRYGRHEDTENTRGADPETLSCNEQYNTGGHVKHAPLVMTKELPTGARWKIWLNFSGFASPSGCAHKQNRCMCHLSTTNLPAACHAIE